LGLFRRAAKGASKNAAKRPTKKVGSGAKLEDIVIQVLKANGKAMKFPEIRDTITSGKL